MKKQKEFDIELKDAKEVKQDFLIELENLMDISDQIDDKKTTIKLLHSVNNLLTMRYIFDYATYCDQILHKTPKIIREAYGFLLDADDVLQSTIREKTVKNKKRKQP